jgi:DNA (cytosine-5)-methyltransferase 1
VSVTPPVLLLGLKGRPSEARAALGVEGPNYCGDIFYEADALDVLANLLGPAPFDQFDAIHASPPCQAYSQANNIHGRTDHPDLVGATRDLLAATGLPYVIENVPGAPLVDPYTICGLSLGLNVKRHRLFETNFPLMTPPCRDHTAEFLMVFGGGARRRAKQLGRRGTATVAESKAAMGIDWMTRDELSQAIPPAYTELIGHQLMQHVRARAAA